MVSYVFSSSNYKSISALDLYKGNGIMAVRLFSTNKTEESIDSSDFMVFPNADIDKVAILNYIKGKAGIYM